MRKSILIISRNGNPMPPRTQMILDILSKSFDIEYIDVKPILSWKRRINYLTLYYFDIINNQQLIPKLKNYDAIMIKDLQFLPLAKHAKKINKYVVYETLDFYPQLRFYGLKSKFPFFNKMKCIMAKAEKVEKKIIHSSVDALLVNSKALSTHFNDKAIINFYSSPFEYINLNNDVDNQTALLYLGHFSKEKGACEMIDTQNRLGVKLYIFGGIGSNDIEQKVKANENIIHYERLPSEKLSVELKAILESNFLFGLSLIHNANESYAVQNANKDIDYLAMGIPLIGNHRETTEDIIVEGCGVFFENIEQIKTIDSKGKKALKENSMAYYKRQYSNRQFEKNLLLAFKNL